MKYKNAAEILPETLLREIQKYAGGELLYIPKREPKSEWGTVSGTRLYYRERNEEIKSLFKKGYSLELLAEKYGLACSTIRKIIYE